MLRAILKNYKAGEFYAWYGTVPKKTISVEEKELFTWHTSNSEACTYPDPPPPAEDKRKES